MRYRFFYWWVKIAVRIYFKQIHVAGRTNIPPNTPVIFALNHQNSLLDALVMAVSVNEPVHFMTRADVFKNKKIAQFLKSINLIPIYRIRDGYSALSQNEEVINYCIELLKQKKHLLIFPEGSHNYQRHLRPLKKGIARIAVDASIQNNAEVLVIPVGINYGSHKHSRSWLHIEIGTPISTLQCLSHFDNHKAKAENFLLLKVESELKTRMVNVEQSSNYLEINDLAKLVLNHSELKSNDYFYKQREITEVINQMSESEIAAILPKILSYKALFEIHHLNLNMMGKATFNMPTVASFITFLLLPLFLIGALIFFPPLLAYRRLIKGFKDKQWTASIKVISIMILYPIWAVLLLLVCMLLARDLTTSLLYIGGLLILATTLVLLKRRVEHIWFVFKMWRIKIKCPNDYSNILFFENEILKYISNNIGK